MNRFFSKCIAGAALAAVLWSPISAQAGEVLDRVNANKVLKMATDANLPPLSFINDSNEMDGFDVSVGREIANRLGVELEIITPEWTMITAGHWNGRWDISIGSMTPTADRAKVFDFPAIYYYTPASFVVHKDSKIQTKADLNGTVIGAPSGTTYEKYLRRDLVIDAVGTPEFKYEVEPGTIKTLSASTALMDDLRLGPGARLDAIIYALPSLKEAIGKGYPFRIVGEPVFYEPLAVAIEKGDNEFNDRIAEAIAAMKSDGTLSKLSVKWFGVDYAVPNN